MEKEKADISAPPVFAAAPPMSPLQNFSKAIKTGVYNELYKRGLLTDAQLSLLLQTQIDIDIVTCKTNSE